MGRNRTSSGDQGRRADEDGGDLDLEEYARVQFSRAKQKLMGGMLTLGIGLSLAGGVLISTMGKAGGLIIGLVLGVALMFIGMVIAVVRGHEEISVLRNALQIQREAFLSRTEWALREERKVCGDVAVDMAKAVANRVANRLLARHASNLLVGERREAAFQETDEIIGEEIAAFQAAVRDEAEADEKK